MKLFSFIMLLLLACLPAAAATYAITPSTPLATIQADLAATGPNTYNFSAGTYSQITSTLNFPCATGNVYTGVVAQFIPGAGISPTTVFAAAFKGSNLIRITGTNSLMTVSAGCTVENIWFQNQNVYIQPPVSGLNFTHNRVSGIVGPVAGTGNTTSWAGVYIDNGTAQDIGYSSFTSNTFGPSCSDIDSSISIDYGGTCGGIIVHGSNVGLTVANNNTVGQVEEFFHTLAQGTNGQISKNLTITNNDLAGVHRIGIELQQQDVSSTVVQYNDMRDEFNPAQFSFLISAACCGPTGGSSSPGVVIDNNVLYNNVALSQGEAYNVGYGIELWGNGSRATNNLLQALHFANAIALGGYSGSTSTGLTVTGNTIQGNITSPNCEYSGCQFTSGSVISGNVASGATSSQASTIPVITQNGAIFTISESAPNTSIWYTIDGTNPFPGLGTAKLYSGAITLPTTGTVKAVGMWGTGANPYTYDAGYGYTQSQVASATYTAPPPTVRYSFPVGSYQIMIDNFGNLTLITTEVLQ